VRVETHDCRALRSRLRGCGRGTDMRQRGIRAVWRRVTQDVLRQKPCGRRSLRLPRRKGAPAQALYWTRQGFLLYLQSLWAPPLAGGLNIR